MDVQQDPKRIPHADEAEEHSGSRDGALKPPPPRPSQSPAVFHAQAGECHYTCRKNICAVKGRQDEGDPEADPQEERRAPSCAQTIRAPGIAVAAVVPLYELADRGTRREAPPAAPRIAGENPQGLAQHPDEPRDEGDCPRQPAPPVAAAEQYVEEENGVHAERGDQQQDGIARVAERSVYGVGTAAAAAAATAPIFERAVYSSGGGGGGGDGIARCLVPSQSCCDQNA